MAWGVAWAGEGAAGGVSRKAMGRASAFAWALCDERGAVALYECTGRAEGEGDAAVAFRRTDEAKLNAPAVLIGDADIDGVAPLGMSVFFGGAAEGSRWMFALREVEKDMIKKRYRGSGHVVFTAPDGTGGKRYWMLRDAHGAWRRPGGGCLDWEEEGAEQPFFSADEAEWRDVKRMATAMGERGWHWTETPPEGVVGTMWGREVWRHLGDAVDGLTPAKKTAAEWFGRVLAKESPDWTLGIYRALEDAKAEELFGGKEFYRQVMENPPFRVGYNPWQVLYRLEELMPGTPYALYASTVLVMQEGIMGGQFLPPWETSWVLALEKCTDESRPRFAQYVLKGQHGPAEGCDYAILGGPGGRDDKRDGPDAVACVRWLDGRWRDLGMPPPPSLLDAAEVEDLRVLAAAARGGAAVPVEDLKTRWGREVAKGWEMGRAIRVRREAGQGTP